MENLSEMKCSPVRAGDPALTDRQIAELLSQVPGWELKEVDGQKSLERVFKLKNFAESIALTDRIAALAERENHHPRIVTEWGKVTVQWWTHVIRGLHSNDFIMAARTSLLVSKSDDI